MPDQKLLLNTKLIVGRERKLTALVIEHLQEVEARKLYCDLKYKSLFQYCMIELGYSEDQACRRINAMRVTKKLPQVKTKLNQGKITLTSLNLFSSANNELELSKKEQSKLLNKFEGKSKRECISEVDKLRLEKGMTPKPKRPVTRAESGGKTRVAISLEHKVADQLKQLASERKMDLAEMITYLVEKESLPAPILKTRKGKDVGKGRYIPRKVKQIVRAKAVESCENCQSSFNLQYEHSTPYSMGGKSSADNIKLLFRNCNLRAGVKVFGKAMIRWV